MRKSKKFLYFKGIKHKGFSNNVEIERSNLRKNLSNKYIENQKNNLVQTKILSKPCLLRKQLDLLYRKRVFNKDCWSL